MGVGARRGQEDPRGTRPRAREGEVVAMVEGDEGRRTRRREGLVLVGRTVWQIVLVEPWLLVWNSVRGSLEQESMALVLPPVIRDVDWTYKIGTPLYCKLPLDRL